MEEYVLLINKMPSVWVQALREHNAKGMWCIPKKGTAEYERVKVIMDRIRRGEKKPDVKEEVKKIEKKMKKDKKEKKSVKIKI